MPKGSAAGPLQGTVRCATAPPGGRLLRKLRRRNNTLAALRAAVGASRREAARAQGALADSQSKCVALELHLMWLTAAFQRLVRHLEDVEGPSAALVCRDLCTPPAEKGLPRAMPSGDAPGPSVPPGDLSACDVRRGGGVGAAPLQMTRTCSNRPELGPGPGPEAEEPVHATPVNAATVRAPAGDKAKGRPRGGVQQQQQQWGRRRRKPNLPPPPVARMCTACLSQSHAEGHAAFGSVSVRQQQHGPTTTHPTAPPDAVRPPPGPAPTVPPPSDVAVGPRPQSCAGPAQPQRPLCQVLLGIAVKKGKHTPTSLRLHLQTPPDCHPCLLRCAAGTIAEYMCGTPVLVPERKPRGRHLHSYKWKVLLGVSSKCPALTLGLSDHDPSGNPFRIPEGRQYVFVQGPSEEVAAVAGLFS